MAALLLFAVSFYTGQQMRRAEPQPESMLTNEDFIRFHVIANSNLPEDQALKQTVRDGLLERINRELTMYAIQQAGTQSGRIELTIEESRQYVQEHLQEFAEVGRQIVRNNGYNYTVTADIGARYVPEKTYGNVTFPAGEYEALNVVIGSGKGENWWCVLFPPLCMIGAEAPEEMDAQVLGLYQQALWDPRYDQLLQAAQAGQAGQPVELQLKFKSLEYMKQLSQQ